MSSNIKFTPSAVDIFAGYFASGRKAVAKVASTGKVRVASLDQLIGMSRVSADVLVRHAQQDFWQIGHDEDGFYIERLVDDGSGPVQG